MRYIVTLLLLVVAVPAWAKWVKYSESEIAHHYLDPDTIRVKGDLRRAWELQNYKQRREDDTMSARSYAEYDCEEERIRIIELGWFAEPMAAGLPLWGSNGLSEWRYVVPGSVAKNALKIVCGH